MGPIGSCRAVILCIWSVIRSSSSLVCWYDNSALRGPWGSLHLRQTHSGFPTFSPSLHLVFLCSVHHFLLFFFSLPLRAIRLSKSQHCYHRCRSSFAFYLYPTFNSKIRCWASIVIALRATWYRVSSTPITITVSYNSALQILHLEI